MTTDAEEKVDGSSWRSRQRSSDARASTENVVRISGRQLKVLQDENAAFPWHEYPRPRTRRDCLTAERAADGAGDGCNAERPCPWVSCKFHLAIDVDPFNGNVKTIFPDRDLEDLVETCALDVAECEGGATLDEVGSYVNVTRERIRQLESRAMKRLSKRASTLRHLVDDDVDARGRAVSPSVYEATASSTRTPGRDAAIRRATVSLSAAAVNERPKPRPDRERKMRDPNADWWRDIKPEDMRLGVVAMSNYAGGINKSPTCGRTIAHIRVGDRRLCADAPKAWVDPVPAKFTVPTCKTCLDRAGTKVLEAFPALDVGRNVRASEWPVLTTTATASPDPTPAIESSAPAANETTTATASTTTETTMEATTTTTDCKTPGCPRTKSPVTSRTLACLAEYCSHCRTAIRMTKKAADAAGLAWAEVRYSKRAAADDESPAPSVVEKGEPIESSPALVCRCGHTDRQHTDASGRSACGAPLNAEGVRCGCFGFEPPKPITEASPNELADAMTETRSEQMLRSLGLPNLLKQVDRLLEIEREHIVKCKPTDREVMQRELVKHAFDCIHIVASLGGIDRARQLAALMARGT